jgi:hypothetical protein
MYEKGEGVPRDDVKALIWYRKAADQGEAFGQFMLGSCYEDGRGVSADGAEAVRWYRKAAEQGLAHAQYSLGRMYEHGHGVPKDSAEAEKWYRQAAAQGNFYASDRLGQMYATGDGVAKDGAEAQKWWIKAANQGWPIAEEEISEFRAKLAPVPAAQPGATGPAAAVAESQPTFTAMTMAERESVMAQISKQDTHSIFQSWISSGRTDHDLMKQYSVGVLLARVLQEKAPNAETVQAMEEFIADGSNSLLERAHLIHVLNRTGTKESLDILIGTATTSSDHILKREATEGVGDGDRWHQDGRSHDEMSPALERVWSTSGDQELLRAVASAMAKVGAPSGVELLFRSALAAGTRDGFRAGVAMKSLSGVTNPDAIPVLSAHLSDATTTNDETTLASGALVGIFQPSATAAVLDWLERTDEYAVPFARYYAANARSSGIALQLWKSALDPAVRFRSESNREAIRAGLAGLGRGVTVTRSR